MVRYFNDGIHQTGGQHHLLTVTNIANPNNSSSYQGQPHQRTLQHAGQPLALEDGIDPREDAAPLIRGIKSTMIRRFAIVK
jgi:hypothetical protein